MTPAEAVRVLAIWERADMTEMLYWRVDSPDDVRMFATCSDLFYWATADLEEITPQDLPALEQTLEDLLAIDCTEELPHLFAARKRQLRPQAPCYKYIAEMARPLYDACCTAQEREAADKADASWWAAFARSQREKNDRKE